MQILPQMLQLEHLLLDAIAQIDSHSGNYTIIQLAIHHAPIVSLSQIQQQEQEKTTAIVLSLISYSHQLQEIGLLMLAIVLIIPNQPI